MSLRRRFLWMVLFALFIAQTMGLMHRVVHVPVFGADSSVVSRLASEFLKTPVSAFLGVAADPCREFRLGDFAAGDSHHR